jgi:hypothetical protein
MVLVRVTVMVMGHGYSLGQILCCGSGSGILCLFYPGSRMEKFEFGKIISDHISDHNQGHRVIVRVTVLVPVMVIIRVTSC